jgi:nuclear pore complex protein Nup98-Nup96
MCFHPFARVKTADKPPKSKPIREVQPLRKYERVSHEKSITKSYTGAYMDAGLALGRSFRVGWGPNGELVHLGKICGVSAKEYVGLGLGLLHVLTCLSSLPLSPSVVSVSQVPLLSNPDVRYLNSFTHFTIHKPHFAGY